ncbi:hypothetical protein RR47_GL001669 [Enterococcus columbae DSM 7374 = ATCC 51263]|nr:hypothetical protein RR47_GL001669 [Enterococcus columbae DSM 7374 = ATCC 51263]
MQKRYVKLLIEKIKTAKSFNGKKLLKDSAVFLQFFNHFLKSTNEDDASII